MKTIDLIDSAIRKFPHAKQLAVDNFCFSAPTDKAANQANVAMDARLYNWNSDTVNAIKYVLSWEGKI
jgi:hypothetical protein